MRFQKQTGNHWCALVVLLAICSLTISVATRYNAPPNISSPVVKTFDTHASEATRQHLAKDSLCWVPPVFTFAAPQTVSFNLSIRLEVLPPSNLFFAENIFSRPPPSA